MNEREMVECNYLRQSWINESQACAGMQYPEPKDGGIYGIVILSHFDSESNELVGSSLWLAKLSGDTSAELLYCIYRYLPRKNRIAYLRHEVISLHNTNRERGRQLYHYGYRIPYIHKRFIDTALSCYYNEEKENKND